MGVLVGWETYVCFGSQPITGLPPFSSPPSGMDLHPRVSPHLCAPPLSPPRPLPQAVMAAAGLNEDGKRRKVVVTGCLAQRYSEQLAKDLPEADLVWGMCERRRGTLPQECG